MPRFRLPAAVLALAAGAAFWLWLATGVDPGRLDLPSCLRIEDRGGALLRFFPDARGERHIRAQGREIPPIVRRAFMAAEDERFLTHGGVDGPAVLRALLSNAAAGRVVSGASTITQQLVRLAYPRPRTLGRKALEAVRALRVERRLSKEDILVLYLNRVPMGNQLVGVQAAAGFYFGKSCAGLDAAEAALLAALPKAPGALNPRGPNRRRLRERRDWVLGRMRRLGWLDEASYRAAMAVEPAVRPRDFPLEAPHLTDDLMAAAAGEGRTGTIRATVDLKLQKRVEETLLSHRERLAHRGASQAAAVVLDARAVDVLALAGSLEYSPAAYGFNNGAAALRSPGSALKPFLYALALDTGWTAATVIEDTERRWRLPAGEYLPANFNRAAYGPVALRDALGNSLNLAAVNLLNAVGGTDFYAALKNLGLINRPEHGPGYYGLGLVVGNPEVSLVQLAAAYAALARGGLFRPPAFEVDAARPPDRRIFLPASAYIVSSILADPSARAVSFGGYLPMNAVPGVALKTGTSTGYRDGWIVGYTPEYVVGVWAGNFDGSPTWNMSGASLVAPILHEILAGLYRLGDPPPFERPPDVVEATVCAASGMKPGMRCGETRPELFISGTAPAAECSFHRREGTTHDLPGRYASWLARRHRLGAEGRYRLAGFGADLDEVFRPRADGTAGRPRLAPGEAAVVGGGEGPGGRPGAAGGGGIDIVYPLDGDRYILEAGAVEQPIVLKAVSDVPEPSVTWYVDGVEHAVTGPPYEAEALLGRGRHVIIVEGPAAGSASIAVGVE